MLASQEVAQLYQTGFVRNARAVGALWAACTLCFAVLEVVVLIEPSWVRTGVGGLLPAGSFGLFEVCVGAERSLECRGALASLSPVPSFKTAAVFVCAALVLVLASVCCLGLYRCCCPATVYKVCAWLQLSAASCQALGCLIFPVGWGTPEVQQLCGAKAGSYRLDTCSVHWAFVLAILGVLDALVLSVLAFVLGNRQDTLLPQDFQSCQKGLSV
ncbi:LHFPL tetraspan subfamily member 3 protein [Heterodontus francisci]|uniref:LHFPL tetraspan subfamily member 3 protein n=1 Tax=Heterodontus francisci TaxID=7792 RepID=UPI00355B2B2C